MQATSRSLLSARRSVGEVRVLSRVVPHLRPQRAPEVEHLLKRAAEGGTLIILTPEPFSREKAAHMELAGHVRERLEKAGLPKQLGG